MKRPIRSILLFSLIFTLSASNILSAKPRNRPSKQKETDIEETEETEEWKEEEKTLETEKIQQPETAEKIEAADESVKSPETQEITSSESESADETAAEPVLKVRPWYIYKKTAKKVAAGPFDTVEDALRAWIMNPKYKSKKGFFIGRDGVLFTDSPDTFYTKKYNRIKEEIEYGLYEENQNTEVPPPVQEENSVLPESAPENTEKAEEIPSSGETQPVFTDTAEVFDPPSVTPVQEPEKEESFSVPEFKPQTPAPVFTGSDYEKTYLSDYITKEVFELPDSDYSDLSEDFTEDPNETDSKGVSLLMKAAKEGNDWKIRTLLNAGASVNARDKDGWTPLMYAVRYQSNLTVLDLLLAKNAEIKTTNNYSLSPLIIAACFNDNPDIIRKLLSYYSPSDKEVQKAFVQLISTQQTDHFALLSKVKLFLDFGLPVNSYYEGKTPLMYACKYCSSTKVIKLLLDKNAAVTVRSTEGKTAFDYAQTNKTLPRDEIYWSLNKR